MQVYDFKSQTKASAHATVEYCWPYLAIIMNTSLIKVHNY